MARASRDSRLENRTNRLKLASGKRYYAAITSGLSLVYRRSGKGFGTWYCRAKTETGVDRLLSIGVADDYQDADGKTVFTYSQAQECCRELSRELAGTDGKPVTVSVAVAHYLEWFRQHRKDIKGVETTIAAHILPAWADTLLMDIQTAAIRRWHERLAAQPARVRSNARAAKPAHKDAPKTTDEKRARRATANRVLSAFKAILNKAFQDGLVGDDRAWRRVKPFPNTDEPVTRFLSTDESTRLINASTPDFRGLVKAALFTGCRCGELTRMLVGDVNLDTGMVYVNSEAKSGKGRHVPLSDDGLDFFRSAVAGKVGSEHVFTRADGEPWGTNHHVRPLKEACARAKIEPAVCFHELRHTYASLLAQAGADLLTISKLLGHADTRITSRHYAHLCDKTLAKTVRALLPSFGHQAETKVRSIR